MDVMNTLCAQCIPIVASHLLASTHTALELLWR